jgi:hypothetical protein
LNCGEKICRQFVVSGCDAAIVLNLVEEALDEIALAIEREITVPLGLAVGFWRDDRRDVPLREAIRTAPASSSGVPRAIPIRCPSDSDMIRAASDDANACPALSSTEDKP